MPPLYDYRAIDALGKNQKGMIEAETAKAARMRLKKGGLMVTKIMEKTTGKATKSTSGTSFFAARASAKDMALLTRQLASLVKANIPLVEALNALVDQTDKESLKITLSEVRDDVNEGSSLAKAIGKYPNIFDHIFINMVEAGEASGTLGLVLIKLADLKEAQMRLRNKIISGMTYPALMAFVGFFLMIAIFVGVIPELTKIFDSMNKEIPPLTIALMTFSDLLVDWWMLLIIGVFIGFWVFKKYIETKKGKRQWDGLKLRMPLIGDLIRMIAITRFASTMSTLLGTGVPILTAMNIAKNLVGNSLIEEAVQQARENVTEGQSIAEPLKRSGQFPPMVLHMISIGEKTGELSEMLTNVSDTYEEQVSAKIDGLTSLLEPMMIIVMGAVVALIVFAVFVPLMEMSNIQ
jgi:general secretion pathway protein F